jgi:glucuronokinase
MMIEARSYARAGLLGNPSDGYFGKTISISVRNFGAHVSLYESPELCIEQGIDDSTIYRNIYDLVDSVNLLGYYGGVRLIKAAIKKFWEYTQENDIRLNNRNFTIRFHSSIPRQIGLAGSSAIITATLRALLQFYDVEVPIEIFPNIALSAEKDELGINAGLQDRVIQAYEGCVYMDFDKTIIDKKGHGNYERLDPALLPNLYIAYKTELGKVSGTVLNDIRTRWDKKDPLVLEALGRMAEIAAEGSKAILDKNQKKLFALMNENLDCRAKIMHITDDNWQLVNTARKCGASAKFTGSGGSIIGMYEDDKMLTNLIVELKKINARIIKPYVY